MTNEKMPPEPVRVDNRRIALVGTAIWLVALLVIAALDVITHRNLTKAIWICVVGVLMGFIGLLDLRRRNRPGYRGNR